MNVVNLVVLLACLGVISWVIWNLYGDAIQSKAKQITHGYQYIWQNECDSDCAKVVGAKDMELIDAAGCFDLSGYFPFDQEHVDALNDKIDYIPCPQVPKKSLNPSAPRRN